MKFTLIMMIITIVVIKTISSRGHWNHKSKEPLRPQRPQGNKHVLSLSFNNSIFKITIEITLDTTQNGIGDNIKYDDQNDVGNDNCKVEGCVKGICCKPGEGENGKCKLQPGRKCRLFTEHCVGKPGVSVKVKKNPEVWMCKTWDRLRHLKTYLDKIRASILEVNYKDLTSYIRIFNNGIDDEDITFPWN